MEFKRVRVVRGHAGLARFYGECAEKVVGEIPRVASIRSPFVSSPAHVVTEHKGVNVIVVETAQRRFEVFAVPAEVGILPLMTL